MANPTKSLLDNSFPAKQRLRSKLDIDALFASQDGFFQYPFKVVFKSLPSGECHLRVLISVPKRTIRKAVDRNKAKRLIREAWRKNKSQYMQILSESGKYVDIGLVYSAKTILTFNEIEKKIILILQRLVNQDK